MKTIFEFLNTKLSKDKIDKFCRTADEVPIRQDIVDKYKIKFRVMKTGNVEAITETAVFNGKQGLRFVFYIYDDGKACLRRQHYDLHSTNGWSSPPANMGEFNNVEEMCEYFNSWADKKLSL